SGMCRSFHGRTATPTTSQVLWESRSDIPAGLCDSWCVAHPHDRAVGARGEHVLVTEVPNALPGGSSLLRNEPVQARSSARLAGLLDAAAAIIDEIGFERLTTAMVAERAGASIGTVYRYFPDRIAVVEALALRCIRRLAERVDAAVVEAGITDWHDTVDIAIDTQVA